MLPIASAAVPATADELARALTAGFRVHGIQPSSITAKGGAWPAVDELAIDLSGATATRETKLPERGEALPETISIARARILGEPVRVETAPVYFTAELNGANARFFRQSSNALTLALERAESGTLEMKISRAELEKGIHAAVSAAAKEHGADIKSTELEWDSPDPRSLAFRVSVRAKAFIMSTTVKVRGRLELDDDLNAQVSELRAEGEGMLSSVVEGFLKPHLAKIEGRPFALGALVAGGLRVKDLTVTCGEELLVRAAFANGGAA